MRLEADDEPDTVARAIASMLARIGVTIDLNAQPKSQYFAKVLASGGFDTSFYLLGWTPGSFDSWNILFNLLHCRDDKGSEGGSFNPGDEVVVIRRDGSTVEVVKPD